MAVTGLAIIAGGPVGGLLHDLYNDTYCIIYLLIDGTVSRFFKLRTVNSRTIHRIYDRNLIFQDVGLLVAGTAILFGANCLFLMNFKKGRWRKNESQIRERLDCDGARRQQQSSPQQQPQQHTPAQHIRLVPMVPLANVEGESGSNSRN